MENGACAEGVRVLQACHGMIASLPHRNTQTHVIPHACAADAELVQNRNHLLALQHSGKRRRVKRIPAKEDEWWRETCSCHTNDVASDRIGLVERDEREVSTQANQ